MSWRSAALCQAFDSDLFMAHSPDPERAKRICFWCPVIGECLNAAINYGEDGIWGGTTMAERQTMKPKLLIGGLVNVEYETA